MQQIEGEDLGDVDVINNVFDHMDVGNAYLLQFSSLRTLWDLIRGPRERKEMGEENKRSERVIKGVVVLICCVLPCKQPIALASLMDTSV